MSSSDTYCQVRKGPHGAPCGAEADILVAGRWLGVEVEIMVCRDCFDKETKMMTTLDAALAAANRVMHGEGSEDDIQLTAGVLVQILASPRWRSEWRTGAEWVRLP